MKKTFTFLILSALIIAGCKKDEPDPNNPNNNNNTGGTATFTLNMTNLPDLGSKAKYEGWLIVDGDPKSTGKFTSTGGNAKFDFDVSKDHLSKASTFIITIEPEPDNDQAPSATKFLAGDFNGGNLATLSVVHKSALNNDFASATGNYILATPTTQDMNDEYSGVWFIKFDSTGPETQGLTLPTLPAGWKYEGWGTPSKAPVSTGKFTNPGTADESSKHSGSDQPGPNFPGEDFIVSPPPGVIFPNDLRGQTVYITIEPDPDNRPDQPFMLKALNAVVSQSATTQTNYSLSASFSQNLPTGTATRP